MSKIYTVKRDGQFIDVLADGEVIGTFKKTVTSRARDAASGYYDAHRIAKGDTHEYNEVVDFRGDDEATRAAVAAIEAGMPEAFKKAQWAVRTLKSAADPVTEYNWAAFNFLAGIAGGCAWYGNTPKNVVAAIKRAQAKGVQVVG